MRLRLVVILACLACATPAYADATLIIGRNQTPTERPVKGFAFGAGKMIGFEFEYASNGEETDEELSDLWSAVERFESMVEARGGDTMTNAPTSAEPDNPAFVLPERKARESPRDYTRRILEAAAALTRFERSNE